MTVKTLGESVEQATRVFHTFSDGRPDLIRTGLGPVDRVLGGMFPGSCGIMAAATGVGKSQMLLEACYQAGGGIISAEDGPDVLGSRALSRVSNVDSLKIRTKRFDEEEQERLILGAEKCRDIDHVKVVYAIGARLDEVEDATAELAAAGCRMVWLDYIQKVRGVTDDRRNEVSTVYTTFQRACARANVAGMAVSQFSRQPDPFKEPQISWLKESGDLENEARLIVLLYRDGKEYSVIRGRVAKSTYGGDNLRFFYQRDQEGILREGKLSEEEF